MTTRSRKTSAPATPLDESPAEVLATSDTLPVSDVPAEAVSEPVKETGPEPGGSVTLVYRGDADVFEHGPFRIRPGQPVVVPSNVAEELLTYPRERFEKVESQE